MSLNVTRRSLLAGSAAAAAVHAAGANAETLQNLGSPAWDETADVLVVGGGLAGMSAALSAKENGAGKVMLIEKGSFLGGHAVISGGGFVASGTKLQKAAGIEDSWENDWEDSVKRGLAMNGIFQRDPSVAKIVFQKHTEALEWLQGHGVKFEAKVGYGFGNANRRHFFAPRGAKGNMDAMVVLADAVAKAGVEVRMKTRLTKLITETPALGSRVTGIAAETKGGKRCLIQARNGVILACGGFAADPEMLKRYHPYLKDIIVLGSSLVTGDGFKAAAEIGVPLVVTHNELGGTFDCVEFSTKRLRIVSSTLVNMPVIIVTADGKRFINESIGSRYVTSEMAKTGIKESWWIIDGKSEDMAKNALLKNLWSKGLIREYGNIGDLARGEGIDEAGLKATVEQYNRDVAAGKDSVFGRVKLLQTVEKAPIMVLKAAPSLLYTYSGLEIDTETRVLNTMHVPVPGLYAAGDTSGRHDSIVGLGQGGISGLGVACVTGRIAGEMAAKAPK